MRFIIMACHEISFSTVIEGEGDFSSIIYQIASAVEHLEHFKSFSRPIPIPSALSEITLRWLSYNYLGVRHKGRELVVLGKCIKNVCLPCLRLPMVMATITVRHPWKFIAIP